ncbi:MAG: oligosaccharide repeat unit polymerase [Gaiellaceae bacterium]
MRPIDMRSRIPTRMRGRSHEIHLHSVFSPLVFTAAVYAPLLFLYSVSSPEVFANDFDSRKALTWTAFAYFALALLCFVAGTRMGGDLRRSTPRQVARRCNLERSLSPAARRSLAVLVGAALVVSLLAFLIWGSLGVVRAGGPMEFIEIWRSDPFRIKGEILATVPGVTTLMQLAVAAIPLAVAYGFSGRGSAMRTLVVLALCAAAARSVFFSERLAVIELIIPLVFLALAPRKVTVPRVAIYAATLLVTVIAFFTVTELRRSYAYTGDFSASRATTRFFGYYLTSVNNGMAIVDEYPAATPFLSTGQFFWEFPVVGDLQVTGLPPVGTVSLRYVDAFGVDPVAFWPSFFFEQDLDPEFNVVTTPGYLAADFGWAGLIGLFLLGLISGRLYRRSETSVFHRALYAVWIVGLFEFMRIIYFVDTRVFPAYVLFVAAYLVLRRYARASEPASTAAMQREAAEPA